jgi:hypothetical protein
MHPRARRLAVAFAMAVEAGMPGVTAVSVVSQWAESLFKHRAESRGGDQLLRSIWIAKLIVRGMPKEQLESCFSNILAGPAPKGVLEEAAVAVAAEAWNVDAVADDASFLAWHGAAYLLGTVDRALSPTHANAVFIECARVLAAVYRWNSK